MAVTYSATTKTARMQTVADALGAGCLLVIGTSALSGATGVLATVTMATKPTVSGSVLTLQNLPATVAASAAGTAALAELRTSGGTVVVSGLTVGTSATDVVLNTTTIASGQNVTINSGTLTHF